MEQIKDPTSPLFKACIDAITNYAEKKLLEHVSGKKPDVVVEPFVNWAKIKEQTKGEK